MSKTKTPQTDAEIERICKLFPNDDEGFPELADFARKLELQRDELLKDKQRLDWLDKHRVNHIYDHFKFNTSPAASQKTWRDAIDQAITAGDVKIK